MQVVYSNATIFLFGGWGWLFVLVCLCKIVIVAPNCLIDHCLCFCLEYIMIFMKLLLQPIEKQLGCISVAWC